MTPLLSRQGLLAFLSAACLVQGVFLAPVVANLKHANRRAVRILALVILSVLPSIFEEFIGAAGLTRSISTHHHQPGHYAFSFPL